MFDFDDHSSPVPLDTDTDAEPEILTIDMLHQHAYCPRRMHLMYVDGRWDDNHFTEEGTSVHRRVDAREQLLPDPEPEPPAGPDAGGGDPPPAVSRSVSLTDPVLGLTGKLDLVETAGGAAIPVETRRGSPPDNPEKSWEPQRIQLMAQALLLRARALMARRDPDDKRRDRVAKVLLGHGDRVQFSVYCCALSDRERIRLADKLRVHLNHREDQVLFLDAGPANATSSTPDIETIGRAFTPPTRCQIV